MKALYQNQKRECGYIDPLLGGGVFVYPEGTFDIPNESRDPAQARFTVYQDRYNRNTCNWELAAPYFHVRDTDMSLSSEQYAFLAARIYKPLTVDSEIISDTRRYDVRYVSPPSSTNYGGAVVQDRDTLQIIVVNKGTDPSSIHDIVADGRPPGVRARTPDAGQYARDDPGAG